MYEFDVIVVGGGAGGGTLAQACARAHKSVLLVERGGPPPAVTLPHDERATLVDKQPYDDRLVQINGVAQRLYMGGVLGGGTSVFGGAMLRPSADDFTPGKYFAARLARSLWEWPIHYEQLEPYYDRAERLYGVAGRSDDDYRPLARPRGGYAADPLPLAPINERLMAANRRAGLRPFQLPLAIDARRCLQCDSCAGFICPNGARRSAADLVRDAVAERTRLQVLTGHEAERFERGGGSRIEGIWLNDRTSGTRRLVTARRYVLAAGAIGSPVVLMRSGLDGAQLGRNYMFHLSPIVIGLLASSTGADEGFIKQVGFADYYFGSPEFPHKLGIVQSLPAPGPLLLAKALGRQLPAPVVRGLRRRMLPLAGTVEDLPDPKNRVLLRGEQEIAIEHRYSSYDQERGRYLSGLMKRILKRAGAILCVAKDMPSNEHIAHQCGTLRFGNSPREAVLDADCRVFQQPELFVVDGSFMPTSLGVGPSLTIAANALRVADILVREV